MSVLGRKLRRDLVAARGMLTAVVAVVALGIGALVGFQATSNNLMAARDAYYARCRLADFWIDLHKAPRTVLAEVADIAGVAALRGRIAAPVIVDLAHVPEPISGLLLSLPGSDEGGAAVINDIVLRSGRPLDPRRDDEVLVSEAFARHRGLAAGDTLALTITGERRHLRIVGTAISAEFADLIPPGALAPEPADYGVFYVGRQFAENATNMAGAVNSIVGLLTPAARADPEPVMERLDRVLAPYGVFATTPLALQSSNLNLTAELGGLATMATTMPLIFLTVAALVLNVLMTRLAAQQAVIVGTLKALGWADGALRTHFVSVGVLVGLVGGLLGGLLGWGLAAWLTEFYRGLFAFPSLPNRFYLGLILLSLAIALCFAVLGTLRGVRQVTRLSPAEAMHPPPPPAGGKIVLERFPVLWRHLGFFWQMALRNVFRNRGRSLVGIFAAAVGTSLLVSTFGLVESLAYMVGFQFDQVMVAEYTLNFRTELDGGALDEARRLPGVQRAEPVFAVAGTLVNANHSHKGVVVGLRADATLTVPRDGDGTRAAVPAQGLLMARRLAAQLGVGLGDRVWLIPTKGTREPRLVPITGLLDSLFGLAVYADYAWLNALVGETDALSAVKLRTAQTPAERAAFLAEIKRMPTLESCDDLARERANLWQNFVVKLGGMSYTMILFGAVIFFGAILNAALIGLIERHRELATYRVLGYRPREVGTMLLRESLLLNLTGIALGLPLGWWMLVGMNAQYTNDLYMIPSVITPTGWAWSIGLALAFVLICQYIVQRQIDRMDWREALAMKE
ncbi:ABC transporter permease [uncultured Thiodictyon sp.]|uniref:ABC transporter permease n=1 Tax=uncultured Thiodictyon sp. TaxID=1846217 RepID=UPI0025E09090|nr:ABC transporter permease [uncultured Thiodictyon sp.]